MATMLAWEIKNKYIFSLHDFSEEIINKEWEEFRKHRSSDDFEFCSYLMLHKRQILEKHNDRVGN